MTYTFSSSLHQDIFQFLVFEVLFFEAIKLLSPFVYFFGLFKLHTFAIIFLSSFSSNNLIRLIQTWHTQTTIFKAYLGISNGESGIAQQTGKDPCKGGCQFYFGED